MKPNLLYHQRKTQRHKLQPQQILNWQRRTTRVMKLLPAHAGGMVGGGVGVGGSVGTGVGFTTTTNTNKLKIPINTVVINTEQQ